METGLHPPPVGFPHHLDLHIREMHLDHWRQHLICHFGSRFYNDVESADELLLLPIVEYRDRWTVCIFVLYHWYLPNFYQSFCGVGLMVLESAPFIAVQTICSSCLQQPLTAIYQCCRRRCDCFRERGWACTADVRVDVIAAEDYVAAVKPAEAVSPSVALTLLPASIYGLEPIVERVAETIIMIGDHLSDWFGLS